MATDSRLSYDAAMTAPALVQAQQAAAVMADNSAVVLSPLDMFPCLQVCQQVRYLVCCRASRLEFSGGATVDQAVLIGNSVTDDHRTDGPPLLRDGIDCLLHHAGPDRCRIQNDHGLLVCQFAEIERGIDRGQIEGRRSAGDDY